MNAYLVVILTILVLAYLLEALSGWLNVRHAREELPGEFEGYYDAERYATSQRYLRENTRFALFRSTLWTALLLVFIPTGGFNLLDRCARAFGQSELVAGLVFAGILVIALQLLGLPFSWYDTFVIEERYGFNKTTRRTFLLDQATIAGSTDLGGAFVVLDDHLDRPAVHRTAHDGVDVFGAQLDPPQDQLTGLRGAGLG